MINKKYTRYIFLLGLGCTFHAASAQEQPSLKRRADQLYTQYKYADAASIYLKLVDTKKPKLTDLERLADCYQKMNDYEAAENWYARVIQDPDSKAENLIKYGAILKSNSRYTEAKKVLKSYADKTGDVKRVTNEIAGCDSALVWMAKPTAHKIKNEAQVNTVLAEFGVFPNGNKILYTAEPDQGFLNRKDGRTGNPFLRIYTADRSADNSLSAKLIDKSRYNDENYHVGPIISNKKGDVLYVTRTYPGPSGEISKENKTKFRTNNLELYIYTAKNGKYEAVPFPYNEVKKYSVGHAALSQDEKILYFVSDMPGGLGNTDIWYCELQSDGSWGKPQNAGPAINTSQDEMFPNIGADGTLYYSSNGLPGMGGLDVFSVKGAKSNWSKPVNLRFPVNSPADDFAFITNIANEDAVMGYLSSNRRGGIGNDDIYSFSNIKPKMILALKGITLNKKTGETIDAAMVTLYANGRQIVAKQISSVGGTFFFELTKGTDYSVIGQKEKFYSDSATVSTKGLTRSDTLSVTLRLEPLFEIGKTIVLQNIHYDFDKDNIRKDAAKILDELVRIMRDNPTLEIELGSHTDSRGVDIYNLDLSQRRARSVVNYLVSRGISRTRLTAKGYGETQLLNRCENGVKCSEAEHQANRRTEFKIVKY
ncbi:outer membrane protein OmpA-like peptidoglycan-associated protein/tetratricopeptide (TPR) repeat protein [Pedobacter africanus]|uniref:Outer membrane protein OmpA-like peptidoglycan-associated protein/tetratricopeptide (TPR) repeat protein n=1 Tax=Pedobacter africanus TaxID=151894 RepID=A0ACC6L5J0_9SPHI|nr:OmpA family protein [Pedobacter africanus]MDR6786652.1 outer membrane protein OmpA-like peptidoglycan-associated protein/tetratricopeptide (TPR) repeat protein [Pedobacter africanus]